jgi:hypothetical protein
MIAKVFASPDAAPDVKTPQSNSEVQVASAASVIATATVAEEQ